MDINYLTFVRFFFFVFLGWRWRFKVLPDPPVVPENLGARQFLSACRAVRKLECEKVATEDQAGGISDTVSNTK